MTSQRPLRVDAQRNRSALLNAGAQLVAIYGAELPFEEVARAAGVGKGTLYRHFATRDHLIAAVLRERFDGLAAEANELLDSGSAHAVETWLRSFDRVPTRFRGLGAMLSAALVDDASAVSTACIPMKVAFSRLLGRAQRDGTVRTNLHPVELLSVVAALPESVRNDDGSSRYLDVLLRGLRP